MTDIEFQSEAERLLPRLKAMARRYVHDDDAADVAQDVVVRLWELRADLHRPVDALAFTLVRNVSVTMLRRSHHNVSLEGHDAAEVPTDDMRIDLMMRLIDRLTPMQQLVIRLRHISGEEMADIAVMTGISEVAVRKCLSRGRQALRKMMMEEMKR